jgi:PleD family two-component response regulator
MVTRQAFTAFNIFATFVNERLKKMQRKLTQRILFISSARMVTSLRRSMNARGFAVTFEQNGREAFDQLTRSSFDVVVIDLISTAAAGELIERIRKIATLREIPIVIIGEWGTGRPSLALTVGADVFEPAPINAAGLIGAIGRVPKTRAAAAGKGH